MGLLHLMLSLRPVFTDLRFVLHDLVQTQLKLLLMEPTLLLVDQELLLIPGWLTFEVSLLLLKLIPFNTKIFLFILKTLMDFKLVLLTGMGCCHWRHQGRNRGHRGRELSHWCHRGRRNFLRWRD